MLQFVSKFIGMYTNNTNTFYSSQLRKGTKQNFEIYELKLN